MSALEEYWALVVDVWQTGVFGVDIGRIIVFTGIFLVFFLLRKMFLRFTLRRLRPFVESTENKLDESLLTAVEGPVSFVPVALGFFLATEFLGASGVVAEILESANRSLIVFVLFWTLYRLVIPLSVLFSRLETALSAGLVDWLLNAVKIAIAAVGVATILEIWGIEVVPILAGLGLFGVAVALGAQDLFKNLIAGIFIIGERRFEAGDWVKVEGVVEGTVETIGFRTSLIRRFDRAAVFVPNSALSDNAVVNYSRMTARRISWLVALEYRTTLDQLRTIRQRIEDYVLADPDFEKPPVVPTFVRVDSFNDSSIDLLVYCFTKTTVWGEWLEVKERLALKIKEIVEGAGAGFAFPSQSLYVETLPAPERVAAAVPERAAGG